MRKLKKAPGKKPDAKTKTIETKTIPKSRIAKPETDVKAKRKRGRPKKDSKKPIGKKGFKNKIEKLLAGIATQGKEKAQKKINREKLTPLNWKVIGSDELLKIKLPEQEFLIQGLIPVKANTIIQGHPSSCKSWLLLEIAKTMASDRRLFSKFKSQETRVLYIDEESSFMEIQRRWKMMNPDPLTLVDFMSFQDFKIDDPEKLKALLDFARDRNYKLILFDSFSAIHSLDENSARETQIIFDALRELNREGIATLICHHLRKETFFGPKSKSQALRGSSNILAKIDSLIHVEKESETQDKIRIAVRQLKLRQGKRVPPFRINILEQEGKISFEYFGEIIEAERKLELLKQEIPEFLEQEKKSRQDIVNFAGAQGYSERTVGRALKELIEEKSIKPSTVKRKKYFELS